MPILKMKAALYFLRSFEMFRKIWFFSSILSLLIGIEMIALQSIVLNSEGTKILALGDPSVERKRWWIEALTGDALKYPEKEIKIPQTAAYLFFGLSGLGFAHSFFFIKNDSDD